MGVAPRTFTSAPARLSRVPLLIGIMGPSGGGKTWSALRLAAGIQSVQGGETEFLDTEHGRAQRYAKDFRFNWTNFEPPFSPYDYVAALESARARKPTTIIVDSMSHEHEGPGGVLEMFDAEFLRLGGETKGDKVKMLAWSKPKQARQRLINTLSQLGTNVIFCFRAKEKIKMAAGEKPTQQGWMPIAGDEFLFEMDVNFLLPPGADGLPQWEGLTPDQLTFMKAPPKHFRHLLKPPRQLDEQLGADMARWAMGDGPAALPEAASDRRAVDLGVLKDALSDGGLTTPEGRIGWIRLKLKLPTITVGQLTQEQIDTLNAIAKEGV